MSNKIPVKHLGQSGWKISFPLVTVYIDPYLSNSVQELDSEDMSRLQPITLPPDTVTDANYVLITHDHLDHCDPFTLPSIAKHSPLAKFIGPWPVIQRLREWGIEGSRCILAQETWQTLAPEQLRIAVVPAAHLDIERDEKHRLTCIGFVIEYCDKRIYIAGDTRANKEVIDAVNAHAPIHTAVLPVNEHNYYREKRGIAGNMSIREAFQFAEDIKTKNLIPVHWDMFSINSAYPEEIMLLYRLIKPDFKINIKPTHFDLNDFDVSVIIRTLNEEQYLEDLLVGIGAQKTDQLRIETIIVDSGSSDRTLEIARQYKCHVEHIEKNNFSFGRSLNQGCRSATGEILVFISGHCVPYDENWIRALARPIQDGLAEYTYGRQIGGPRSFFSECRIFEKYYPPESMIPQENFFCNNANSAILREAWERLYFDEELTGLEDLELAQRLMKSQGRVAYCADSVVIHHHSETWPKVRRRFEREAIAMQKIMPQLQVGLLDTLRYILISCVTDVWALTRDGLSFSKIKSILLYRWNQYIGTWLGNHKHRQLSRKEKEKYFYPS